jgi:hypothetical protein
MIDIVGFIIWIGSGLLKRLFFLFGLILGVYHSIKDKKLGDYFYSLGIGNDIWGNKLIAPHANKYWIKKGGRKYGGNETISKTMAYNKRDGYNTSRADFWENLINKVDKNHLSKVKL